MMLSSKNHPQLCINLVIQILILDNGFNNNLKPLSDVIVSPKFTSSSSLVKSPNLTLEFTTPSFNNSSYKSFCCLVPFNGVCNA